MALIREAQRKVKEDGMDGDAKSAESFLEPFK
jgi:hypothetical protein